MTGLSASTLEIILLVLTISMTILSFMYRRTKNTAYNVAFILAAIVKTEAMKKLARKEQQNVQED